MIKILSIGNSFSQDATRYLHQVAASQGVELLTENLYIGGCSLARHEENIRQKAAAYSLEINGRTSGMYISIQDALLRQEWDYVTMQQVSSSSTDYTTYQPYLTEVAQCVKTHCPNAKLLIHQTWAYEDGSDRLENVMHMQSSEEMFRALEKAYAQAAEDIRAAGIIPSGALFRKLLENGIEKVHRDTFHASLGLGRYALALLWYGYLTKKDVAAVTFRDFDEPVSDREMEIAKKCVSLVL